MAIQNNLGLTQQGIIAHDGSGILDGRTITAGTGISVANGDGTAGNPTISSSALVPISFPTDSGTATPSGSALTVAGDNGINTSGSGATVTVNLDIPVTVAHGGTGLTAALTAGSVVFSNGTTIAEDNSNFFWDDSNNRLGIGTTTPLDELHVVGAVDIVHTAAGTDEHALEIDVHAGGFGDIKAIDVDYETGALSAGDEESVILINIDESSATGGEVYGFEVLSTTLGSATLVGYKSGIGIDGIHQDTGTFGDADLLLNKAVDVTAALADGGAGNITVFAADNDTFTISDAAVWSEGEFLLDTGASGSGIAPTFEFSDGTGGGTGFTTFVPIDGTNGFRNTGIIAWDLASISGTWATNVSGLYEIRITRTRNGLSTVPIFDEVQISTITEHKWDKNGDVNINSLTLATPLTVPNGGTGNATHTAYAVICGGTTTTAAQQSIASVGTSGMVLTSNGAGALPTMQAAASSNADYTLVYLHGGM